MPINGSGVYSLPSGVREDAVASTPITSSFYRAFLDDIVTALNTTKPVVKGGTGGTTVAEALASFGLSTKGSDLASAAELPVVDTADFFDVTGTTTITSFAAVRVGKEVVLQFDGSLKLTHNATDLILPDGEDIQTLAGDIAIFREYASGDWVCVAYIPNERSPYKGCGFDNVLQNPGFRVDIEGNAAGVTATGEHVVEGYRGIHVTDAATITTSRIAGEKHQYALQMEITTGSDATLGSGQYAAIQTAVEGFDVADALWGTANAKPGFITFWAKASVAGTYAIGLLNSAQNRGYPVEIALTTTLQKFVIRVPGDTSGTWEATEGTIGLLMYFGGLAGSTYQGTNETWNASPAFSTSSCTNFVATNGATITIEAPSISFETLVEYEKRPYSLDLAHSQRYYSADSGDVVACFYSGTTAQAVIWFPQDMASTPTMTLTVTKSGTLYQVTERKASYYITSANADYITSWIADARLI